MNEKNRQRFHSALRKLADKNLFLPSSTESFEQKPLYNAIHQEVLRLSSTQWQEVSFKADRSHGVNWHFGQKWKQNPDAIEHHPVEPSIYNKLDCLVDHLNHHRQWLSDIQARFEKKAKQP